MNDAIQFLRKQRDEHIRWSTELCRIPSISTQDAHKADVRAAIEYTRDLCDKIGFKTQVFDTERHPILLAERCNAPGKPTWLAYGHADVQPEGDLSLWDAGPFEPVLKDDWLICRGSSDDKGQLLLYLRAAQAIIETAGELPINLKLLIEGEEEIGSPNLTPFVEQQRERLACDHILICDTGLFEDGWPTITTGTRGMIYKEVVLSGPKQNLHSGMGGPIVNPANALAKLVASLHDEQGRVTIPGFYDDVEEPPAKEREVLAGLPFDEKRYAAELGVPGFAGEQGWSISELSTMRPTLDVNGVYGGYMEKGANTIIPAQAGAKMSMRLVPAQDAADIANKFDACIRERCPAGVRCEIIDHAHCAAYVTPIDTPVVEAADAALKAAFGRDVAYMRCGGSLPILPMFKRVLGTDCLLLGFASPASNAHGPNEKVNLKDLDRAAETLVGMWGG